MAFWLTGAAYLLHSCLKAVELLVPLCNGLISVGFKKEETDSFLAPKNLFILHILADLEPVFNKIVLKTVDKDDKKVNDAF